MAMLDRDEQLSRLLDELHARRNAGQNIDATRVRAEYPDLADEALHLLATEETVASAASDWREAARDETCSISETGADVGREDPTLSRESASVPETLGRYKIVRLLGRGGMGSVYEAIDPQLNRRVAIKLPTFAGSGEKVTRARQRFLRESRAAASIDHANVCAVYDAGDHEGQPFVVMAYIQGQSLFDRLKAGPYEDQREAAALIAKTADGLAAVHALGITHRDIKPGNILLASGQATPVPAKSTPMAAIHTNPTTAIAAPDGNPIPKLTDFGLAAVEDDGEHLTQDGTILGTPAYMAPEQASADLGPVTAQSDIYSLGAVLFEMLTGRKPFEGSTTQIIAQVGSKPAPRLRAHRPDADPALDQVLARAMARQPADRFATAQDFADALRGWLAGTAAPELKSSASPSSRKKKSPILLAVVAVAAVVVVLGLALGGAVLFGGMLMLSPSHTTRTGGQPAGEVSVSSADPAIGGNEQARDIRGYIDVRVWRKESVDPKTGEVQGTGMKLSDRGALPLSPGDFMRVEAKLNRPAYVYVVWLDTEGKPSPLYPWQEEWKNRPAVEKKVDYLSIPEGDTKVAPLGGGPAGIESLMMLVRDEPLPQSEDLESFFKDVGPQNGLELASAVWIENGKIVRNELDRGKINVNEARLANDPVLRTQAILRDKLKGLFPFSRAVCFSNTGDK